MDVLPGKVRFDCAGSMFCEILRVVHLGRLMTTIYSLIPAKFINIIIIIIIIIIITIIIMITITIIIIIINIISIIIFKP